MAGHTLTQQKQSNIINKLRLQKKKQQTTSTTTTKFQFRMEIYTNPCERGKSRYLEKMNGFCRGKKK